MVGLSLTGGGARGAYQAGVILGLSEVLDGMADSKNPFPWYAGISAGSINSTFCAASSSPTFKETAKKLADIWLNIKPNQVYRTDVFSLSRIGLTWVRDTSMGTLFKNRVAKELLDARPLHKLLTDNIEFENIDDKIESGEIKGVTCSSICYDDQKNVSFVQANNSINMWQRTRRYSKSVRLRPKHLMASCAIPVLFSPVRVSGAYYGDGTLRNTAPISPILHLGCQNFFLIGVRYIGHDKPRPSEDYPSIARVFGTIVNGSFFDLLDNDLERINQINQIVTQEGAHSGHGKIIKYFHIQPSKDLIEFAVDSASGKHLPSIVKYLLGGLGNEEESADLASYLLFVPEFTEKLVELGYEDVYARKKEIQSFWKTCHS